MSLDAQNSATPLAIAREIMAGYDSYKVLHGVSIRLDAGEFVGLAGPNGSGKTTLLHCLTGYHGLMAGEARVAGENISKLNRREIAAKIAFVPQRTETVYSFTVQEMVLMGRHPFAGLGMADSKEDVEMARDALASLEIGGLASRKFGELSGGEKQMALLARAFVQRAPILILDEPLTGLDIRHQFQLMNAIRRSAAETGHAALATFHDLAVAARWCTRLILMRDGRIIDSGAPAQVITPENLAQVYGVEAKVTIDDAGYPAVQVRGCITQG